MIIIYYDYILVNLYHALYYEIIIRKDRNGD